MDSPSGLRLRRGRPADDAIELLASALGGRVGAAVLDDLDRRGRRSWAPGRAVERSWTFDRADRVDLRWWPQGIDLGEPSTSGRDQPVVAVTWYAKKLPGDAVNHGARVTFYDVATARYRHVLLVRPTLSDGVPGVTPLRVHAGGLVWAGEQLYVAATAKGFWAARLGDVVRVPDRGVSAVGDAVRDATFGYDYLLPVHTGYAASADEDTARLRYSFFSRDGDDLVVGEYAAGSATRRLARIPLEPDTLLPAVDTDGHVAPELLGEGVGHMQGVVRVGARWYATTSHGRSRLGSVWTGTPGAMTRRRWAVPMGPEDLTFHPPTDRLWSVTEHPWARWICSMERSWFD